MLNVLLQVTVYIEEVVDATEEEDPVQQYTEGQEMSVEEIQQVNTNLFVGPHALM